MYEQNVFAVLTACDYKNGASNAFKAPHNSKWFRPAAGGVAELPTITSREPTPADDEDSDEEQSSADRLVITFDELLVLSNLQNGIQLGTNPNSSHILLGHRGAKGISAKQCNITVDEDLCVWLHDYHSSHGTAVWYRNQKEVKKRDTWILADEPGVWNRYGDISIHSGRLAIKIEFPNHGAANPRYVDRLRKFFAKCQEAAKNSSAVPAVDGLSLASGATTQAPSSAESLSDRVVYFPEQTIGRGAFGEVLRLIRARDRKYFAAKTFTTPTKKRNAGEDDPEWLRKLRREFNILKDNPHANVIQVFELRETPTPMIIMAYYRHGDIAQANFESDDIYVTALGQILDALSYLHPKGVVHRDLKPDNILIETEPLFKVVITDFGLAKVIANDNLLTTFCGSLLYAAPEVFPGSSIGHGPLVDIWSLGVITLRWLYGIPTAPNVPTMNRDEREVEKAQWVGWVNAWSKRLLRKLNDEDEDQVTAILGVMIRTDQKERLHAKACLALGMESGLLKRRKAGGLIVNGKDNELPLPNDTPSRASGVSGTVPTQSPALGAKAEVESDSMAATIVRQDIWRSIRRDIESNPDSDSLLALPRPFQSSSSLVPQRARKDIATSLNIRQTAPPISFVGRDDASQPVCDMGSLSEPDLMQKRPTTRTSIIINDKRFTVRDSDGWIDAFEVLSLVGLGKAEEQSLKNIFGRNERRKERKSFQSDGARLWISYGNARLLCERFKLLRRLAPLLEFASQRTSAHDSEPSTFLKDYIVDYHIVASREGTVYVRVADWKVNATHITKAAQRSFRTLTYWLRKWDASSIAVHRGFENSTGRYVDIEVALRLCTQYRLGSMREELAKLSELQKYTEAPAEKVVFTTGSANESQTLVNAKEYASFFTGADYSHGSFLPRVRDIND